MNKSTHIPRSNSLPVVKSYTFRKLSSMIESLVALDFRGAGIVVNVDHETLSTELVYMMSPYRKTSIIFQVAADGSILVLGNGHSNSLRSMTIQEMSGIISDFLAESITPVN